MIIDTEFGTYELIKDYRNGFDIVMFNSKYIPETFDKFTYIVGDVSSGILRLKGFSNNVKSVNSYKKIPDYLNESCNMNTAYFILKRYNEIENIEEVDHGSVTSDDRTSE
jgi:uncharacterized protein YutD